MLLKTYLSDVMLSKMNWTVFLDPAFEPEFLALPQSVQDELLANAKLLETFGPRLGRPRVDTLEGIAAREHEGSAFR